MFETTMTAIAAAIAMLALLLMALSSVLPDLLENGNHGEGTGRFSPGAGPCPDTGGSSGPERRSGGDFALLETRPAQARPVLGARLPAPPALVDRPLRFWPGGPRSCSP